MCTSVAIVKPLRTVALPLHGGPRCRHVILDLLDRRADQHRVMDRRANLDAALGQQAARQPQHLGGVCLHWKILERSWLGILLGVQGPAEHGADYAVQHCAVYGRFRPRPEFPIRVPMEAQQFARYQFRLTDFERKRFRSHSVKNS